MNLNRFPRYTQNLGFKTMPPVGEGANELRVYSYNTHVATQVGDRLVELGYHSMTTRKHINYAAEQLGLTVQYCKR